MDAGILRALKTVKNNPYVQYVGLGLANLVTQKEQCDKHTGQPLKKTKFQLIRISAAVCGIELCYAAETAFVSPILLKLGVPASLMTMVWCLSPVLGFFLVPVMGSLSDRCRSKLGRRRPFIILLSIGIVLGLALVPNGEALGILLGDTTGNSTLAPGTAGKTPPTATFLERMTSGVKYANLSKHDVLVDKGTPEENVYYSDVANNPDDSSEGGGGGVFSFSTPTGRLRGIVLTILGVALLDFNCDACQSPCRAYLLDISLPEYHSTGLTMFTVMAGAGGAVGYLMGGIDWNATGFGEAFGGHIRVVFTAVLVAFLICVGLTLTSFRETPLSELNVSEEVFQRKKKRKGGKKYKKFTNEDSSFSTEEEEKGEKEDEKLGIDRGNPIETYGSLSQTTTSTRQEISQETRGQRPNTDEKEAGWTHFDCNVARTGSDRTNKNPLQSLDSNTTQLGNGLKCHLNDGQNPPTQPIDFVLESKNVDCENESTPASQPKRNGLNHAKDDRSKSNRRKSFDLTSIPSSSDKILANKLNMTKSKSSCGYPPEEEISPYAGWTMPDEDDLRPVVPETMQISTDVTLKTYLSSIVRMPRCLWVLCLCNLFCWMSLVCYSLYFTDFVGQAVFHGNPKARADSESHIRYDQGVRLGSFGMSLYSLACAGYSLLIERLVNRFRAKTVYVVGQLVFTVGMAIMAATRHKMAVILLSPSAGIMYATLFTMPYMLVAHYHTRGLFTHGAVPGSDEKQVRGLGTDVAIISSMVFLAQFLLSVFMGTLVSVVDSTVTVMIASSVLSFLGAVTATQVTYLDM